MAERWAIAPKETGMGIHRGTRVTFDGQLLPGDFAPHVAWHLVDWANANEMVPLTAVRAALKFVLQANYARVLDERRAASVLEEFMQRLGEGGKGE